MSGTIPARVARTIVASLACAAVLAAGAEAAGASEVIYNDLPAPLPGNVRSEGFEATQTAEFGGQVQVAGAARRDPRVTFLMSSWACQSGAWFSKDCVSAPNSRFQWPMTFRIYEVGPEDTVGALLASGSKVFKLDYRPTASPKCTGEEAGKWYRKGTCFNGKAFKVSMQLKVAALPEKVIVTAAFNTSDYGAEPQPPQPCDVEAQGCPYDSLNVGIQDGEEPAPSIGSFPAPDVVYRNGAPETGWTGFQPLIEIKAR